jgi:hypothetical protein
MNRFIKETSQKIHGQPNLFSHSFRKWFIMQLWKDTSDIEFVRQAIVNTTSLYLENLSEVERREHMQQVTSPKELILKKKTI